MQQVSTMHYGLYMNWDCARLLAVSAGLMCSHALVHQHYGEHCVCVLAMSLQVAMWSVRVTGCSAIWTTCLQPLQPSRAAQQEAAQLLVVVMLLLLVVVQQATGVLDDLVCVCLAATPPFWLACCTWHSCLHTPAF